MRIMKIHLGKRVTTKCSTREGQDGEEIEEVKGLNYFGVWRDGSGGEHWVNDDGRVGVKLEWWRA